MYYSENKEYTTAGTALEPIPDVEPAKSILQNTDGLLCELHDMLSGIDDAVFGRSPEDTAQPIKDIQPADNSILDTLNRQRAFIEKLLHIAEHIKRGLW